MIRRCPECRKNTEFTLVSSTEYIEIGEKKIDLNIEIYRCLLCGEEFSFK